MIHLINKKIYIILFIFILIFQTHCFNTKEIPPIIQKGILDVNQWDFSKGYIPLKGEWEFYFNELLYPDDFKNNEFSSKSYLYCPSSWTDLKLPNIGYATYRIKIKNLKYPLMMGLKIPYMNSSYRLFVNGELIAKNGIVDTNPALAIPQHLPQIKVIYNTSSEMELILQISNYTDNIGGIWDAILIGTEDQIIREFWISIGLELFFFGVILIMGFYHLFLYFFRNQEKASLYFGLFCFIIALRIFVTGEKLLIHIIPNFPWEIHIKLEYLSIYFGLPAFSYFLFFSYNYNSKNLFQKHKNNIKNILKDILSEEFYYPIIEFIFFVSIPFIFITLFTKTTFYSKLLPIYQIFLVVASIYLLFGIIITTSKKKEGSIFSLIGIIIPFITIINDISYAKKIIQTGYLIPLGIFMFILFQSLSLAYKFSLSFTKIETLTNHLKALLKSFEKFIPKQFLEFLNKHDITQVQIGDQIEKEMTVLFSDIRKFTLISEQLTPKDNFIFINQYFNFVEPVIESHKGFIDKYLGDGFMALFSQSPEDALKCSIYIQEKLKEFNQILKQKNFEPIKVGIGIHTGRLILGVVGSKNRMDTTVISDAVNTSSRLEKLNKDFGTDIIISEDSLKYVHNVDLYKLRYIGNVLLRGKTRSVRIYEVYNHYPETIIDLYEETRDEFYRGILLFTKNQFKESYEIFNDILNKNPHDNPSHYYYYKCRNVIGL